MKKKQLLAYLSAMGKGRKEQPPQEKKKNATGDTKPKQEPSQGSAEKEEGLFKTGKSEKGYRKAAKLFLLIGKDDAAKILKHMEPEEVEQITAEIAKIKRIEKEEAEKLLEEFGGIMHENIRTLKGGNETAKQMLVSAFGAEKGEEYFNKAVPYEGDKPFTFLSDLEYQQILMVLKDEKAHVYAVVLPYLDPKKAGRVLEALSPDMQREVVHRLAKLSKVSPEVIHQMEQSLKERIRRQGKVVTQEIDGTNSLAQILKHMSISSEEEILKELSDFDDEMSNKVREKLYTIDMVLKITDQHMQSILRDYSDHEIAMILKGKEDDVRARILHNVSERRKSIILDEYKSLGPKKRREVDEATKEFLEYLRQLEEEGRIIINRDEDEMVY